MNRRQLPLCTCHVQRSASVLASDTQQISRTMDLYTRMLVQQSVHTPDVIDVYNFGMRWFQDMLKHHEEKEWTYPNNDGFNEYHIDLQMPRYRVSFHLTVPSIIADE